MQMQCPLCNAERGFRFIEEWMGYRLYVCSFCELTFSDPMKGAVQEYYEIGESYGWRWAFDEFLNDNVASRKQLLDVGCGNGIFLVAAQKRSYQVAGLDFNPRAVEEARTQNGLTDIHNCSLLEFRKQYAERKFDVVTSFHIIEHLENPTGFVDQITHLLRVNGYLVLAVPNPKRWHTRYKRNLYDYPPNHLTRWTSKALVILLEKSGFSIEKIKSEKISVENSSRVLDIVKTLVFLLTATGLVAKQKARVAMPSGDQDIQVKKLTMLRGAAKLKTLMIPLLAYALFPFYYPVLKGKELEGEDLYIVARLKSGSAS